MHFPDAAQQRDRSKQGREPRGQTVISFFADPSLDPLEQEKIIAATTVLDIALRDILREDLGQTYTVSVGLSQALPQRGDGHIEVRFGAAPENIDVDDRARDAGDQAAAAGRAVAGSDRPREGNGAARLRDGAEAERLLAAAAADDQDARPRSRRDPHARRAHRRGHAAGAAGRVQEVLPGRSLDGRHAGAGAGAD